MSLGGSPGDSRTRRVGAGAVAVVVLLVIAAAAYLYVSPPASSSSSTFSNSSSVSLTTISTSVAPNPNAVQVALPYGSGEDDDGATEPLPQVVTVVIGVNNTVTWTNLDNIAHQVISNTGVFYSGDLSTRQSFTFTFTVPGTYPYYCSYHPPMGGVVIVKNP